ncbi:hypothetical protein MVEN_00496300 [Mycena venus]|uniref:Uncharacterized protein n=1 Tax=Mycena venus TaxID=2733690 RepID=A0A8H7DB18_9AGAR|nr:hypothetical protein MVEN_00496300 [Mycena venus]
MFSATIATTVITLLFSMPLSHAKSCLTPPCVSLHRGSGCSGSGSAFLADYVPTCQGNCYQFDSFDSVEVSGSWIRGTDCHIYSDINCQHEVKNSGNVFFDSCVNTPGAKSMKCYFNC